MPSTDYVTIVVYVPIEYTEAVRVAMCEAGAGTVGDGHYDRVTYIARCVCKYRVLDKAWEKAGITGNEYENEENRIEAICRKERIDAVVKAIVGAHPYETPAIAIHPTLTGEYKYWKDS
jgi:hypothetical protein